MRAATLRSIRTAVPWLCLAALAGCATQQTTAPPPAPVPRLVAIPTAPSPQDVAPPPSGPRLPPSAEQLESYSLLRDDPAVGRATADLAAASPVSRPAVLMRRAREAIAAAHNILSERKVPFGVNIWSPSGQRFLAYCELALRDLEEILVAHPWSPEAPEAMFATGLIQDFPYLNQFDDALEAYRLTVERYPGTPWARRAGERIGVIESMIGSGSGGPRDGAASRPAP